MTDKKPREFWLQDQGPNVEGIFYAANSQRSFFNLHVIEYSAYDELKKENEYLRKIAKDFQEVCAVGSPTWMVIEETLRENKE